MAVTLDLFEPEVPAGFHYREDFVTESEEQMLLTAIAEVSFSTFEMRGVVARRRVALFGQSYDAAPAQQIPAFLLPLRKALADWAGVDAEGFAMALVNEYRSGTPIGWHRDAPQYDIVAGLSLLSECRMRFRPYQSPTAANRSRRPSTHEMVLQRRSAYLMTGAARQAYEHHIPRVAEPRYSVTFRTLR